MNRLIVAATAALMLAGVGFGTQEDPNLDQVIDQGQQIVTGRIELAERHVDIGPRVVDGTWQLLVHDDTSDLSVWRPLDDVALRVNDLALVEVPDDDQYSFLGAAPGDRVHVVSQTEVPGVVWVGWNTQDPEVMELVDRGVTLSLLGVQGPGQLSVYLQSGNFGAPQVLWSSALDEAQPIWVDVNTHTHANWVFTEPGAYLVRLGLEATLVDGSEVRAVGDVRFAVGDEASTDEVLDEQPDAQHFVELDDADESARAGSAEQQDGEGAGVPIGVFVAVAAAVALVALIAVVGVRDRRIRRAARREST